MYRFLAFFTLVILVFAAPYGAQAAQEKSSAPNPKYASLVIDADTGAVLSERNPDKVLHPASLTKVMTLVLLFESMENGTVRLNDKIMISQRAAAQAPSKIGLAAGSSMRVEDAILALVTKSANDISVAIAEHLAGSEARFAERMTNRARSLGMSRTTYRNAHGLHNPGQVTTARDQATLARYVITRYPNYYRYFSTKQFTYRGVTYTNHNRLMQTYPGMDGFKTGFINASGFNLIASAKKGDRRLIGVVFGGRSWKTRNDHMAEILNSGWSKLRDVRYAKAPTQPIAGASAPVRYPPPIPAAKPVYKATQTAALVPPAPTNIAPAARAPMPENSFTSLGSLNNSQTKVVVEAPRPLAPDVTGDAIAKVKTAMNSGDYSEVTGEGDYDAATARRVEAGLLAAAVYKGEAHHLNNQKKIAPAPRIASAGIVVDPARTLQVPPHAIEAQPIALPPQAATTSPSDLWSVQIGAYTSRVATDDALRLAQSKLPSNLTHASPIVVPLTTGEGVIFRARLGNLTQAQANETCRYFRDCLPVAPR